MEEIQKTIYDLELHELLIIEKKNGVKIEITRVPGGFIYALDYPGYRSSPIVFIPFNDEYKKEKKIIKKVTKK